MHSASIRSKLILGAAAILEEELLVLLANTVGPLAEVGMLGIDVAASDVSFLRQIAELCSFSILIFNLSSGMDAR